MKLFNWNFELLRAIPLGKGEGPNQIMEDVSSICLVNEKLFLTSIMENKIKVFTQEGIFIRSIPLESFIPQKMIFHKDKFYILNLRIGATKDSFPLAKIMNPYSEKFEKDIVVENKLDTSKLFQGNAMLIGLSSKLDMGSNGCIYLLISASNILFEINKDGKLLRKIYLPYEERKKVRSIKKNGEKHTILAILDWYVDMKSIGKNLYICFLRHTNEDEESGHAIYQTHVLKLLNTDKFSEEIVRGDYVIIGEHQGNLYLFNNEDYSIITIKIN